MPIPGLNTAKFGSHRLIADEIGRDKIVLDIGCSKGFLGRLAPDNTFYGIDSNKKYIDKALAVGYKKVYQMDLNDHRSFRYKKKFNFIIFADILEHLLYPDQVLNFFVKNYLKQGGRVIISLPNVAHITVRWNLFLGRFDYSRSGILDRTHLHLYTLKTARELISLCHLRIIKEKFCSNYFGEIIKIFPILSSLVGYTLIFVCQKKS